jgi:copper chaperone CopZ
LSEKRAKPSRAVFAVRGADCVTCALAIEKQVKKLEGVVDVRSSIMLNQVFVDYDESRVDAAGIDKAIRRTGYSNYLIRKS